MNHVRPSTNSPSLRAGLVTTFRVILIRSGREKGSRVQRRHRLLVGRSLAVVFVIVVAVLAGGIAQADASGPPTLLAFTEEGNLEVHATWASADASVDPNDSETSWSLEYAANAEGPWSVAGAGTFNGSGTFTPFAYFHHLAPETKYYARISAKNAFGSASKTAMFTTTPIGAPEFLATPCGGEVSIPSLEQTAIRPEMCGTIHVSSADFYTELNADGAETQYHFEYGPGENGPWTPVAGAGGTITAAEELVRSDDVSLAGLDPETPYYLRAVASNKEGTAFETIKFTTMSDRPSATIESKVKVVGTSADLSGSVHAGTFETKWQFEYATSEGGPWTPAPGADGTISAAEAGEVGHRVEGELTDLTSPIYYVRLFASNVNGSSISSPPVRFALGGPPVAETFAVHALHGEAVRVLGSVTQNGFDTHYHFQYATQADFEAGEWADAETTPEVDAGAGEASEGKSSTAIVGQDLVGLLPGETYHFRLVASNTSPGDPVVYGADQTLTAPVAAEPGSEACPDEGFRAGLSDQLPDCRAYEQITPVDKEGAFEAFQVLSEREPPKTGALVGEDGEHVMVQASHTDWGSGQSPYFFSRASTGWQMAAATAQPEAGIEEYAPQVFGPDLASFAFAASFDTAGGSESP